MNAHFLIRRGLFLAGLLAVVMPAAALADTSLTTTPAVTVRAYPNPWRVDQSKDPFVRFDGFSGNATVKIFTISGEEVRVLRGTAPLPWDLRNGSGESVASGVYLFLATPDGGETSRGKLAIIK